MNRQQIENELREFCRSKFGTTDRFASLQRLAERIHERTLQPFYSVKPPEVWRWKGPIQDISVEPVPPFSWLRNSDGGPVSFPVVWHSYDANKLAQITDHKGLWRAVERIEEPKQHNCGCRRIEDLKPTPPPCPDPDYEHLDPPEFRAPRNEEDFLKDSGDGICRSNGIWPAGKRWIVRRKEDLQTKYGHVEPPKGWQWASPVYSGAQSPDEHRWWAYANGHCAYNMPKADCAPWRYVEQLPKPPTIEDVYGKGQTFESIMAKHPGRTGQFRQGDWQSHEVVLASEDLTIYEGRLAKHEWRIVLDPLPPLPTLPKGFKHQMDPVTGKDGRWGAPKPWEWFWGDGYRPVLCLAGVIYSPDRPEDYRWLLTKLEPRKRKVERWAAVFDDGAISQAMWETESNARKFTPGASQFVKFEIEVEEQC